MIENEKRLLSSNELKTIRLKEVEDLFKEISSLEDISVIRKKFEDFIKERKHHTDSKFTTEAEAKIKEYKSKQEELEKSISALRTKEHEIGEAEKAIFRTESLEKELAGKLNLIKAREETLELEEAEYRRELMEVGHLVGLESIRFEKLERVDLEDRMNQEERKRIIEKMKIRLEDSNISGAGEIQKEYKETVERDAFLAKELSDLEASSKTLEELIKELETRLSVEFSIGLKKINEEFNKLFGSMFGGGDANLTLTKEGGKKSEFSDTEEGDLDEEEKYEEGLDIKVSLPKKKIKSLMMLSGGERALTSIALIFAVSQVNPPPFIILDETDAALDESNSKKYGDMVETLSKHSQLILITHNRETMSRAGVIYGVTMGLNGVSKLLSISFDDAAQIAK